MHAERSLNSTNHRIYIRTVFPDLAKQKKEEKKLQLDWGTEPGAKWIYRVIGRDGNETAREAIGGKDTEEVALPPIEHVEADGDIV